MWVSPRPTCIMPTITTVVSRLQQQLLTLTSILLLSALCSLLSALTLHLSLSPISLPYHCHSTTSPPSPQSPIFHHILPMLGQLPVSSQLPAAPRPPASPVATLLPKARNTPGSVTGTALHWTVLRCTALHCDALHCTTLHCAAVRCSALQCSAVPCALA